ncbi:MAG: peptide ABC transporter substrate-binding protein [Candidatus Sericytochromatia bacterium]
MPPFSRLLLAPALALAVGASALAAGCAGPRLDADTAVVQFAQEPDSLNPFLSAMSVTGSVAALFYSGLVSLDDRGQWIPDLATRVPSVANGDVRLAGGRMRVTYRLRPNVTWHDGQPFSARDVAATWKLLVDPKFPALSVAGYERIERVETPDPLTAVVVFKQPYAPFLELLPFVLPAHVITQGADPAAGAWHRSPMGTGPYRFTRWVSGDRLVATANPAYFRGKPAIEKLEARFVPSEESAFQMWRSGALDLLQSAPPTEYDYLQSQAPGRVHVTPSTSWEHLIVNMTHPVLKDGRVRTAIAHLIDRQQINAKAYGGVFQPAWSDVPTFSWAYNPKVEKRYPFDLAAAGRSLDAAGWRVGQDGLRAQGGKPLTLRLLTTSDKPSRSRAAQIWRRQWREVGIQLSLETAPGSVVFGSAKSKGKLASGDFDLALVASISRPDPDATFRWRSDQVPPEGQNRSRYQSPEMDRLLDAGQRTLDVQARKAIYHRIAERLATDLPVIPILTWSSIDVTSERLQGFRPNPTLRGNLWNVWEWRLADPAAPASR